MPVEAGEDPERHRGDQRQVGEVDPVGAVGEVSDRAGEAWARRGEGERAQADEAQRERGGEEAAR